MLGWSTNGKLRIDHKLGGEAKAPTKASDVTGEETSSDLFLQVFSVFVSFTYALICILYVRAAHLVFFFAPYAKFRCVTLVEFG